MPEFRSLRTGAVLSIPEVAAGSYRRSDSWEEVGAKAPEPDRPSVRDDKATWVAWAESCGHGVDGLTKAEIMDLA